MDFLAEGLRRAWALLIAGDAEVFGIGRSPELRETFAHSIGWAGVRVPGKLATATGERLAEVRGWIEAAGLAMRDGILAADAETLEGVLG